jgi:hypothetical protein
MLCNAAYQQDFMVLIPLLPDLLTAFALQHISKDQAMVLAPLLDSGKLQIEGEH